MKNVASGLHRRDVHFADLVLVVCALGSRFSSDSRCKSLHNTVGWCYFSQVKLSPNLAVPVTLSQLQALMVRRLSLLSLYFLTRVDL